MDNLTRKDRIRNMSLIRSSNTKPEMYVRELVSELGFSYQLYCKNIPGCPDLAFPKDKKIIFVHGCFWHRHCCEKGSVIPKTNKNYWLTKFGKNKLRDKKNRLLLKKEGWNILIVWECQLKNKIRIKNRINKFLGGDDNIKLKNP